MKDTTDLHRFPSRVATAGRLWSRSVCQIGAAAGLGAMLGLICLIFSPLVALGGVAGLLLLAMAFTYPEVVILVMLCFAAGLVPARLNPYIDLFFARFQVSDLLLLGLLFVLLFRLVTSRSFSYVRTPLDVPMALFYAAVLVGLGNAVLRFGVDFGDATYDARMLLYYLAFFVVTNLVRTRSQLVRLVRGVFVVGLLLAILMIAQSALAGSNSQLSAWLVPDGATTRIYNPGYTSVYVVLMALLSYIALSERDEHSMLRWLQFLVLGAALLSTLGRNILVSSAIGCALLIVILRKAELSRLAWRLLAIVLVATALVTAITLARSQSWLVTQLAAYLERLQRMFSARILAPEETLVRRWEEIRFAWSRILQHPLLGIGLYNPYRPPFYAGEPGFFRTYIHNAYLAIWLKAGLAGLVSFLWLSVAFLWRGFRHWRDQEDVLLRSVSLGFALAYLGMVFSNMVAPSFVQPGSLAVFGVVLGIQESILARSMASVDARIGATSHGYRYRTAYGSGRHNSDDSAAGAGAPAHPDLPSLV